MPSAGNVSHNIEMTVTRVSLASANQRHGVAFAPVLIPALGGNIMKRYISLGLAMLAGAALTSGINALHAQGKAPGAYAVLDISEIVDPGAMKEIVTKAGAAVKAAGGQYLARTDKITPLSGGTPPKRFVIIGFDSVDAAKAWYSSPAQAEVNAVADKALKQRWFIVDGAL
jgi:uncharacterized protein (DUF1330 family)